MKLNSWVKPGFVVRRVSTAGNVTEWEAPITRITETNIYINYRGRENSMTWTDVSLQYKNGSISISKPESN